MFFINTQLFYIDITKIKQPTIDITKLSSPLHFPVTHASHNQFQNQQTPTSLPDTQVIITHNMHKNIIVTIWCYSPTVHNHLYHTLSMEITSITFLIYH